MKLNIIWQKWYTIMTHMVKWLSLEHTEPSKHIKSTLRLFPFSFTSISLSPTVHHVTEDILRVLYSWHCISHFESRNIKINTVSSSFTTYSVSPESWIFKLLSFSEKSDVHARYSVAQRRGSGKGSEEKHQVSTLGINPTNTGKVHKKYSFNLFSKSLLSQTLC